MQHTSSKIGIISSTEKNVRQTKFKNGGNFAYKDIYFLEPDQKLSYLNDLDVKSYILHYVDSIFSKWPPFPVINSLLRVKSP